jgi:hypothetical protein
MAVLFNLPLFFPTQHSTPTLPLTKDMYMQPVIQEDPIDMVLKCFRSVPFQSR